MPSLRKTPRKGLSAIGTVRSFASVLREMSFDDIRDEALRTPRILILAPMQAGDAPATESAGHSLPTGYRLAKELAGLDFPHGIEIIPAEASVAEPSQYDAIVVHDPSARDVAAGLRRQLAETGARTPVVEASLVEVGNLAPAEVERLRAAIVSRNLDRAPAIGRAYPGFRDAAVKALVNEAAMANAQFALVSNIPAVIPIVGSLAAAGADFLVLTKNQLMLIFKIAAVHGRDLHDQLAIMREMVPVVGAGLLWRTVARETASFFPFMAGTVPKVVIAYTGTVAAGRGMDFYYRSGRKPSREQMRKYYAQAVETARNLPMLRDGKDGREPES